MDNDLPEEPNDFMAATYANLARRTAREAERETDPAVKAQLVQTAAGFSQLADAYSERYELTHGKKP